ncbi:phosphate signaling complex protein PhoU [Ferrimonas aestuarii]|uniref:Phosphate-specific transport system accessory protein PhoU n=1 Tax=Ferrimonas aestuarii TaxID=2569539 RepID=A0A4U1BV01_9GAMM|nr:phosphate signaling complex protein PhoU [Ferrimonas aestuarii]TKB56651.1 phosphate signaling complex protein PhoU [Ferrimonas aestuarii]
MDNNSLNKHISGQFNLELEDVRSQVMAMGGLLEQQLKDALDAVQNGDKEQAKRVMASDRKINAMEVAIDEECTRIIAKRQPAASDLRLVLAISKTTADLERIGDACVRVARTVLETKNADRQGTLVSMDAMGRHASRMLNETLDAFARMDVDAAFRIHKEDIKVDKEFEAVMRQLMTFMMEDPRSIPSVLDVLWATRALERIGDRCQNICEYVIYFVKGKDVRHMDSDDLEDLLR